MEDKFKFVLNLMANDFELFCSKVPCWNVFEYISINYGEVSSKNFVIKNHFWIIQHFLNHADMKY